MPTTAARKKEGDAWTKAMMEVIENGYSLPQQKKIMRLALIGVDDQEWSILRDRHNLSDEVRLHISYAITGYWAFRAEKHISKKLPGRIDNVLRYLRKLTEVLGDLRIDPDLFKGVLYYYEKSPTEQAGLIDRTLASLHEVDMLLAQARVRIKGPAHRRPTHRDLWLGISIFDRRISSLGPKLTADPKKPAADVKKLAYDIFHLADPKLTQRGFNDVLHQYLLAEPEWEGFKSEWMDHNHR
jgi:hypothetical protein